MLCLFVLRLWSSVFKKSRVEMSLNVLQLNHHIVGKNSLSCVSLVVDQLDYENLKGYFFGIC